MQPLPTPPDVKTALDEFYSWGAVVEHALFAAPTTVDISTHQLAAQSGLHANIEEEKRRAPRWPGFPIDNSRITSDRAQPCSTQQFFGPCYEVDTDTLLMLGEAFFSDSELDSNTRPNILPERGDIPAFINYHFRENEIESSATAIHHSDLYKVVPCNGDYTTTGYTQALFETPHRLRSDTDSLTNREVAAAFRRLCAALFGDLNTLEIYSWPTDCSEYFDAGHEWWGSFFWTVYSPSKNWLVTITASTTD